jgi:hypothetical protein
MKCFLKNITKNEIKYHKTFYYLYNHLQLHMLNKFLLRMEMFTFSFYCQDFLKTAFPVSFTKFTENSSHLFQAEKFHFFFF